MFLFSEQIHLSTGVATKVGYCLSRRPFGSSSAPLLVIESTLSLYSFPLSTCRGRFTPLKLLWDVPGPTGVQSLIQCAPLKTVVLFNVGNFDVPRIKTPQNKSQVYCLSFAPNFTSSVEKHKLAASLSQHFRTGVLGEVLFGSFLCY